MLCGQHALNNLLQAAMYTVVDLAGIARELDALEASQLDPGTRLRGDDPTEGSQNYDDSGFFSVQVMEQAIKVFGLRLVRWGSEEMAHVHDKPELVEGFLLNHQLHWFSIRRFGAQDRFYNLDSCVPQPQWISATYLGLTLREAERQGASGRYSIFAVVPAPGFGHITGLPSCPAANLALSLPLPRGRNSYSNGSTSTSLPGNGHALAGPSNSHQAFGPASSASKPPLLSTTSASSSRKGKRPASNAESDDDLIIQEPSASGRASGRSSVEQESEKRRRRRKVEGQGVADGDVAGAMSEEEMMAAAIRESLRVSGQGGGAGSAESSQPRKGRGDVDEEEEFQRALQASLAANGGAGGDTGNATESEASGDEGAEDSPSIDELRRLRLARFGA
ncbi:hypothetical protein JCM10295v2_003976 [Rhodotorula toruloides]